MGRSSGDDDGEGEHTRFPCLASLCSLVAAVVTLLAVVVVVMVIVVLHRPEKIVLTSYGYVQTQNLWWSIEVSSVGSVSVDDPGLSTTKSPNDHDTGVSIGNPGQSSVVEATRSPDDEIAGKEAEGTAAQINGPDNVVYASSIPNTEPAKEVTILLILFAYNPSGRGKVDCNITSITIVDMLKATPFFANMTQITTVVFPPAMHPAFFVPPQSGHRYRGSVKIDNTDVLNYLNDVHAYETRFRVMTQVNVTYKPLHSDKWIDVTYYCWPVFFVDGTPQTPGGEVRCKTDDEMDYAVSLELEPTLPPAPAPGVAA